jgi:phosphatidylinositol phospholipase C delta
MSILHIIRMMFNRILFWFFEQIIFRYLFYGQLSGDSNPEAYNRALCVGCRAVELDCYDGNDGAPIVTHAFTLVRPCSFESIIRYMEPNLFKTSP